MLTVSVYLVTNCPPSSLYDPLMSSITIESLLSHIESTSLSITIFILTNLLLLSIIVNVIKV